MKSFSFIRRMLGGAPGSLRWWPDVEMNLQRLWAFTFFSGFFSGHMNLTHTQEEKSMKSGLRWCMCEVVFFSILSKESLLTFKILISPFEQEGLVVGKTLNHARWSNVPLSLSNCTKLNLKWWQVSGKCKQTSFALRAEASVLGRGLGSKKHSWNIYMVWLGLLPGDRALETHNMRIAKGGLMWRSSL